MEVKLTKPWRFYENGCRPVDYKAGLVNMSDEAAKVAQQCGVIEKKAGKPKEAAQDQPKGE